MHTVFQGCTKQRDTAPKGVHVSVDYVSLSPDASSPRHTAVYGQTPQECTVKFTHTHTHSLDSTLATQYNVSLL